MVHRALLHDAGGGVSGLGARVAAWLGGADVRLPPRIKRRRAVRDRADAGGSPHRPIRVRRSPVAAAAWGPVRGRAVLAVGGVVILLATGCAGYDEWKCGPGYAYRDGVCKGFGAGFTNHERFAR